MRASTFPRKLVPARRVLVAGVLTLLMLTATGGARAAGVPFTVTFDGAGNGPRVQILNESRHAITHFEMTIGDISKNFDAAYSFSGPPGSTSTLLSPDTDGGGGARNDTVSVNFSGFSSGTTFSFYFDPDPDSSDAVLDYRTVLFNNGNNTLNSIIRVTDAAGNTEELELPDPGAADLSSYTFVSKSRSRVLTLTSVSEAEATDYVRKVRVKVNGSFVTTNGTLKVIGGPSTNQWLVGAPDSLVVYDDETVEVIAPREVYKNVSGADITDSVQNDPQRIQDEAEERYTAIGISVNDVAQTGDPTYYNFQVKSATDIKVKWQHAFALTIDSQFVPGTRSLDPGYAGPLMSPAEGNPSPPVGKQWIKKGDDAPVQVDGQVLDFSHPGLDIRHVAKGYRASGPPAGNVVTGTNTTVFTWAGANVLNESNLVASTATLLPRQQVPRFVMSGPGRLTYLWQIQFGVKVNIDSLSRTAEPRVFTKNTNNLIVQVGSGGEGTYWFNQSDWVRVATPATFNGPALGGWINGDGFYFPSSGAVNSANGNLIATTVANGANWTNSFTISNVVYRGLEIPLLRRPARVLWTYGNQAIAVDAFIGEYVFKTNVLQSNTTYATNFTVPPDSITRLSVSGRNTTVGDTDMAIWDPQAKKLFPLVPGQFRAVWKRGTAPNFTGSNDVIVTVHYPTPAHYPHIAGTPPVALDPDPNDNFIFQALKYTENSAVVGGNKQFTATQRGKSVLLFTTITTGTRGEAREFFEVRVVDTREYQEVLTNRTATIGQKITDALDLAKLGTGYLMSFAGGTGQPERTRFNPFIYDRTKLDGLAPNAVYDMVKLRPPLSQKVVVKKENLPGPIIPVNLHPRATQTDRIIVAWYDDPTQNDLLLWPYAAALYTPQWPDADPEQRGQIVIASQLGSDGRITNQFGLETNQLVMAALTNEAGIAFPRETTYNPSRFQQVQIYSQPDPNRAGYNPNEEHALIAPSLQFADVSPRPPAAFALRDNDLNTYNRLSLLETNQPIGYTSHPFVLVQFFDTADSEFKMRIYEIAKEAPAIPGYRFPVQSLVSTNGFGTNSVLPLELQRDQPHVVMEAGEPVIPFYPLGVVIGASPCPETFGVNIRNQLTYWEDHKGTSWAVSGGTNAWFTVSFYYPLAPDFFWPPGEPGFIKEIIANGTTSRVAAVPQAGDCISFVPTNSLALRSLSENETVSAAIVVSNSPVKVLYKSEWPTIAPVLKAGETLTFQGGEFRADHPSMPVIDDDGEVKTVQTPGLPGIVGFAEAEVVFDSLNPTANSGLWKTSWTARVTQVLDKRSVPLAFQNFPPELSPATGRTRVSQGKYVFNDLPASLQKRIRFDPLSTFVDPVTKLTVNGKLEMSGLLNDKNIGEPTLTAAPPAVYVLEPNIMTEDDKAALEALDNGDGTAWDVAVRNLYDLTRNPNGLTAVGEYVAGLQPVVVVSQTTGQAITNVNDAGQIVISNGVPQLLTDASKPAPYRAFGPGLALVPNAGFLDPQGTIPGANGGPFPDISWVSVVENNDPSLGGSPVTVHVIQVERAERYRGAIKTILSENVFDENLVLRHTGDFGANANDLVFEWWYRADDGSLNVPPPDLLKPGQQNPWKLFSDPSGKRGAGRYQITMKGNPNTPEALLADTFWFVRYRHKNDRVQGTDWNVSQNDGSSRVNFTWAGAGNSDPFNDFDRDGIADYRAQLAQGWMKRVLDAVNPYEARIRDFEGNNPSTVSSMIQQFGPRFEGPVALNPDKNVIENVGLIELYETILKRGRDLSIDLSQPVNTPPIFNALQLASTRLSDFYTILGNEAYTDALDPTIGFGSDSVEYGSLAPAVFAFQNQMSSLLEEELALLRGVDDFFARPVYNRLFWNFTKGEGEAAYAMNYNVSDINMDGFIDEADAMILYPQGHGDAWGHYLTATRHQYDLLRHDFFNWVSRSEFYNLQDIVIKVDFLDERKFAQVAAAKAKTGAEIVNLTYRQKYVEDPNAKWQGYTDSNKDRAWGVQEWARRAGQGAFFDWVTANALLPSQHPNASLEGIQKVDRKENSDIKVISANLSSIQTTFDQANRGLNPLGVANDALVFDIDPTFLEVGSTAQIGTRAVQALMHFDQIYERALKMLQSTADIWNKANESRNMLRQVGNSEAEFRNATFQEDLSYRNQLISIFGKPYEGAIGPGKIYPAGYEGPDLLLFMYVGVRQIDDTTVPGPSLAFAAFNTNGVLNDGDIFKAFEGKQGNFKANEDTDPLGISGSTVGRRRLDSLLDFSNSTRELFSPTFATNANGTAPANVRNGWYAVNYTDLLSPKVPLDRLTQLMPITAAGYTFQAPADWGSRGAVGELQLLINQMIQQEAQIALAIGEWDSLQGDIVRTLRLVNAKLDTAANLRTSREAFIRIKYIITNLIKALEEGKAILEATKETVTTFLDATVNTLPKNLPTAGLAFSPGDALAPARGGIALAGVSVTAGIGTFETVVRIAKLVAEIGLDITQNELELFEKREEDALAAKEMLAELENKAGDEPIKRIAIFKEIEALRALSEQYRAKLDEGTRLIDERAAFNKRVAAQTQRNRYQDMTFRVARNHALQSYRSSFDLAARYAFLAAKAYDYETNFDPADPGSPAPILADIMRARSIGLFEDEPRMGEGGLSEALGRLKANYEVLKGQLGINNPEIETGKMSLRTENYRILPKVDPVEITNIEYLTNWFASNTGLVQTVTTLISDSQGSAQQPGTNIYGFGQPGANSDTLWQETLQKAFVDDLWSVPEFRYYCRPFASESNGTNGHIAEPALVLRFGTQITAGQNSFGRPLAGGDHTYDPSHFATKIQSVGVWFSDYLSGDPLNDLPSTPRVYLIPVGMDVMSVPTSTDPATVRFWKVLDQRIPVPLPSVTADLDNSNWIPSLDSLNGRLGEPRKYSMFRAYHDGGNAVNTDELVLDTRLVGRSVWNTQWLLIIPGRMLNADPNEGLRRFMEQVTDIRLVFRTYGLAGG